MTVKARRCSNALLLSAFGALVAMYFVVAAATTGRAVFAPELTFDRAVPLQPAWTPVYLSMWIFSLLPVIVVRGVELRRRTILSYLTAVITAYIVFLLYPTVAPRPADVPGDGVLAWSLRTLYAIDPPYNCFPSLHVAYAFLAALSTYRVRRGLGIAALLWAVVIAISTLFIKQHYVADVVAGAGLAVVANAICMRGRTAEPPSFRAPAPSPRAPEPPPRAPELPSPRTPELPSSRAPKLPTTISLAAAMIGTNLGSYRVLEKLGEGGMGEVYLADDERLHRKVALKVLPATVANDPDRRQRFEREIRAVSALNHPNILTLFDLGRDGDRYFMATEFIDGRTLREHVRTRGTFPLDDAIEIVVQCAEALDCAHAAGIVHRDIKPENVMIRHDGYVKVLDFGLATTPTPASPSDATETMRGAITSAGVVVGTMGYLSPEQARGLPIDARTDIFSLGVVFYEMLTGVQPFAGATPSDAIASILRSDPPPIDASIVPAPDRVNRILDRALAKDRDARYATVLEFARDLQQLAHGSGNDASDPPRAATGSLTIRIAAVAAVLVAVVLGAVAVQQWRGRPNADRSETASPLSDLRGLRTLAVLPFQLLGYPDGSDHVGLGMADALIVRLAMLRQLTVRPTTAVARYQTRDADVVGIGRSLQVDAVLTGNVQRDTGRTRVTVQLIRVDRNADATAVWSDTYTTTTNDPFEVQDALAAQLVQKLALQMSGEEQARLTAPETTNARARQLFIEGRYLLNKRTPSDTLRAAELFDRAVSEDPQYARAHFSRATALGSLMEMGALPQTTTLPRAREALDRALLLDPQLGEAYGLRSLLARVYDWNFDAAERDSMRAMELNPNNSAVLQWRGVHLLALGRADEAEALHARAVEIDPLDMVVRTQLCRALYLNKRYDRAIEAAREVIALDANQSAAHQWLGLSMVAQGRATEGLTSLKQAAALSNSAERIGTLAYGYARAGEAAEARKLMASLTESSSTANAYLVAIVHAGLGDRQQALAWLERALQQRDGFLPNRVKLDPALDGLRQEPRFVALLKATLSGVR